MNYKLWVSSWLESKIRPTAKERTYLKYKQLAEKYLLPQLGEREIEKITVLELQTICSTLSRETLASNTVNGIVSVLKSSLKDAYRFGLVERDLSYGIVRAKSREKRIESFDRKEQALLERYALRSGNQKLFGIVLALYTGVRIGELLALTWEDVDFQKGMLSITKSCRDSWEGNRYKKIFDTPKTSNSERVIPVAKELLKRLKIMKKESKGKFIITGKSEYGAEVRSFQRTFSSVLKKLNLPHRGFHSLRHTFATRAIEAGMDVKTLSEILGHSDPTITLRRYAHSMLEYKKEMMNKICKTLIT